jgi:hypothetical protein
MVYSWTMSKHFFVKTQHAWKIDVTSVEKVISVVKSYKLQCEIKRARERDEWTQQREGWVHATYMNSLHLI